MKISKTGDQHLVKKINKSIVLKCIEERGPISRADISKYTKLNKATVSTMVRELIREEFVHEVGMGQSSGGRKPIMLSFNDEAGYSIGIDLGVNYILAVLTDLKGKIIIEKSVPLKDEPPEFILKQLNKIIKELLDDAPKSPYGIIGMGIGVPGTVNKKGEVLFTPHLNLKQINLKQYIENQCKLETTVVNEANAGVFGELNYGAGKRIKNLIYISLGIGIGTGLIINNELYTGSSGISGELGHHTIHLTDKKCRCGNYGCWELYASENALIKKAKRLEIFKDSDHISLSMIEEKAKKDNQEVLELLHEIGKYIGIGLTNIIHTFNPEKVILGNRLARFEKWLFKSIQDTVNHRLSSFHQEAVNIHFSTLGKYSGALGAASFAIMKFLSEQRTSVK